MFLNIIKRALKSETTLILVLVFVLAGIQGFDLYRSAEAGKLVGEGQGATVSTPFADKNRDYLRKNRTKEGVVSLPSGLQYKVRRSVEDGKRPYYDSIVTVHYEAKLINGDVVDSTYNRGKTATFPLNSVIEGWSEGVQLMREGEKFILYIPADLAYGDKGNDIAPPGATMIYTVELIDIK